VDLSISIGRFWRTVLEPF